MTRNQRLIAKAFAAASLMAVGGTSTVNAACLAKTTPKPDGSAGTIRILAPDSEVGAYAALGYREEKCATARADADAFAEFICGVKQKAPPQAVVTLTQAYGRSPEALCASVRVGVRDVAKAESAGTEAKDEAVK